MYPGFQGASKGSTPKPGLGRELWSEVSGSDAPKMKPKGLLSYQAKK